MSTISQPMRYYNKTTTMFNNQHRTNLELKIHVSRVVVAGLSRASRVFLRVLRSSSLRKNQHLDLICDPWSDMDRTAAAAEGAFDVPSTWPR